MKLTTLTIDELFDEIADLAREQGASSKDTWAELVDEVVEGHLSLAEIDDDDDVEGMKEALKARWVGFKETEREEAEAGTQDVPVEKENEI